MDYEILWLVLAAIFVCYKFISLALDIRDCKPLVEKHKVETKRIENELRAFKYNEEVCGIIPIEVRKEIEQMATDVNLCKYNKELEYLERNKKLKD